MTQEKIIEGNKIICTYIGNDVALHLSGIPTVKVSEVKEWDKVCVYYHKFLSWLKMPLLMLKNDLSEEEFEEAFSEVLLSLNEERIFERVVEIINNLK